MRTGPACQQPATNRDRLLGYNAASRQRTIGTFALGFQCIKVRFNRCLNEHQSSNLFLLSQNKRYQDKDRCRQCPKEQVEEIPTPMRRIQE